MKQNKKTMTKEEKEAQAYKKALLEGLPAVNLGALFMPPIWGPAHGVWITILYYPMWLFADNLLYAAYSDPTPLSVTLASLMAVILAAATIIFARASQGYACQRALKRGKTKETYKKEQRIWAVVSALIAIVFLAAATYYNLTIRPFIGA